MIKTIACIAVAGTAMAANGQELLAWWSFNNSTTDSNLTWADGNDRLNELDNGDGTFTPVFRHMHDNDGQFNDGFLDPTTDRFYPVFDGFDGFNPGALIDPAVIDTFDLNPDVSLFGAYIDVSSLVGDNWTDPADPSITTDTGDNWGSYGGSGINRPVGTFGGGSLAIAGSANSNNSFDIVADLSNYQDISVSWVQRKTGSGPTLEEVSVSTDGINFTNVYSAAGQNNSTYEGPFVANAGSLLNNASNAIIRFSWNEISSEFGNIRFDNIVLQGTEGQGAACPGDIADDFGFPGGDGQVSFGDFLLALGLLGPCPGGTPGCDFDIADDFGFAGGDGQVSFGDFLLALGLLGPCP